MKTNELENNLIFNRPIEHVGLYTTNGVGILLYLIYHSYFHDYSLNEKVINEKFQELSSVLKLNQPDANFGNGITGTGWLLNHLLSNDFVNIEANDLLLDIDKIAIQGTRFQIKKKNYDFINGAIGQSFYLTERYNSRKNREFLEQIIKDLIDSSSINSKGEMFWKEKSDEINLSLSHGMANKIVLFSKLLKIFPAHVELKDMLVKSVSFVLSTEQKGDFFSLFPNFKSSPEKGSNSRLAWCYGDLGIGISLWQAGEAMDSKIIKATAIRIFQNSLQRTEQEDTQIVDAGICHGFAGVALLYNRMYLNTNILEFKRAARFWCDKAIDFYNNIAEGEENKALFGDNIGWKNDNGLLIGTTGILLTEMSINSDKPYDWDNCLLLC